MDLVDGLVELVEVLLLLLAETVQPHVLVLLVVCYQVRVSVPQVFLPEFH